MKTFLLLIILIFSFIIFGCGTTPEVKESQNKAPAPKQDRPRIEIVGGVIKHSQSLLAKQYITSR